MGTFDLLVVGAGPAGSAAAIAALAENPAARVALLDRAGFPRDKVCGDGITAASVAALHHLDAAGVLTGFDPVHDLVLTSPHGNQAQLATSEPAYIIPRRTFDTRLVETAIARGAELITDRVTDLSPEGDYVYVNRHYRARCVLGADGANSITRRFAGAGRQPRAHMGLAARCYAACPTGRPRLHARFLREHWPAYAWMFTEGNGTANVGVILFDETRPITRDMVNTAVREQFPDLEIRQDTFRAHQLPLSSNRPFPGRGHVLLAGDAASLVNPLTGEGIHTALTSGSLAGRIAATGGTAPAYQQALHTSISGHLRQTTLAANAFRNPQLVETTVAAASRSPRIAHQVAQLAFGTGTLSPWTLAGLIVRYARSAWRS